MKKIYFVFILSLFFLLSIGAVFGIYHKNFAQKNIKSCETCVNEPCPCTIDY